MVCGCPGINHELVEKVFATKKGAGLVEPLVESVGVELTHVDELPGTLGSWSLYLIPSVAILV